MTARINSERLWSDLMETARFGATPGGGLCRLALSEEDIAMRHWFVEACNNAGMSVECDAIGTMFARLPGSDSSLPPIAIGSHLDTQPTGGRFDGIYGVLAGLEVIRTLRDAGIDNRHAIEVVNWTNEEGARFAPAMIASGVFAGAIDFDDALCQKDRDGITLGDALQASGFKGDLPVGGRPMACHFELHIEQGPVLEATGRAIGIVTGVQGMRWFDLEVVGQSCHAGTTPMTMRRDALQAATMLARAVDEIGRSDSDSSLSTIGIFECFPGSRNTVPQRVQMSVDLRHPLTAGLDRMEQDLNAAARKIQIETGTTIKIKPIWSSPPVRFDPTVIGSIRRSVEMLGYSHQDIVSGAGHDSVYLSRVVPTAMIFVPCKDGISHNEAEFITPEQMEHGANVLLHAVIEFDRMTYA